MHDVNGESELPDSEDQFKELSRSKRTLKFQTTKERKPPFHGKMAEDTDINRRIKITHTDGTATTFKRKPTFKTHRNKITKMTENKPKGNDGTERYILRQIYMDSLLGQNRFAVLSEPEDDMETEDTQTDANVTETQPQTTSQTQTIKTKPIFIYTQNHTTLVQITKNIKSCTLKHNVDHTTAKTTNYDDEKKLIDALKANKMEFFTFHKTDNKQLKFFVKHIPTDISTEYVKQDLHAQNINVTNVTRFFRFEQNRKIPTTNLILTISQRDARQMNELKDICHIKVTVDIYKPTKKTLKQCHRCLYYGHHSDNCNRTFRCLRCGKDGHAHNNCTERAKTDKPTCANCKQEHPANYRGCSYYKTTLEKVLNAQTKRTNTNPKPTFTLKKDEFPSLPTGQTKNAPSTSTANVNEPPRQNAWRTNRTDVQETNTTDSLKEIFSFIRELNLPKILTTIRETVKKFKEADSTMAKVMVLFDALSNFF